MLLTPGQCAAARGLLGWSMQKLGAAAGISANTVLEFEQGVRRAHQATVRALRRAFEDAGVEFVAGAQSIPLARVRSVELEDGSVIRLRAE